jgi:hypothetical protein
MVKTLYLITLTWFCTGFLYMPAIAQSSTGSNSGAAGAGQSDPQSPRFSELFPNPTNNNGFEEFVKAADLVRNIDEIDQAANPGATLALKRRVLAKSECKQALELLREGLTKPAIAPKQEPWAGSRLPIGALMKMIVPMEL